MMINIKQKARRVNSRKLLVGSLLLLGIFGANVYAAEPIKELNLYSARHYQTDEALYTDFTKKTGIKINRIEADDNGILERLKSEGDKSQADVILLVDALACGGPKCTTCLRQLSQSTLMSGFPST
jgi:iron(III) transport system substrate-binding protein